METEVCSQGLSNENYQRRRLLRSHLCTPLPGAHPGHLVTAGFPARPCGVTAAAIPTGPWLRAAFSFRCLAKPWFPPEQLILEPCALHTPLCTGRACATRRFCAVAGDRAVVNAKMRAEMPSGLLCCCCLKFCSLSVPAYSTVSSRGGKRQKQFVSRIE